MSMYRHQLYRTWLSLRHRPQLRNWVYGTVMLSTLYFLYQFISPSDSRQTFPLESYVEPELLPQSVWDNRAERVKKAFQHAYHGWEQYAAPHDELKPISNTYQDNFNGWGVTVFDGLDTMALMKLDHEYKRALKHVEDVEFKLEEGKYAPYFETVIRYLGGMLSAYALTEDPILLRKADELARKLDPVFGTPSGLPYYGVNPDTGATQGPAIGILAEIASLQLEYTYLAKVTGKKEHFDRAQNVINIINRANYDKTGGMMPIRWNTTDGTPFDQSLSAGAQADSAHEYLLKQYLLTAKRDQESLQLYIRTATQLITELMYISPTRHLLYVTDKVPSRTSHTAQISHRFEHLSCFLPGLLALGVQELPLDDIDFMDAFDKDHPAQRAQWEKLRGFSLRDVHLWAAQGLAQTCWLSYADMPTGLGPDEMLFYTNMPEQGAWGGGWFAPKTAAGGARPMTRTGGGTLWVDALRSWKRSGARGVPPGVGDKTPVVYSKEDRVRGAFGRDYSIKKDEYLLRPETVESLYLLWKVTGEARWRDRAWRIFEAIEVHTKTPAGYASLRTVQTSPGVKDDDMPSYFFAETLKYLYLTFIGDTPLPLDKWVLNTEAHPFPVIQWTAEERERFRVGY
ncbi:glycoside hydrolase family 47 protein [Schizophyllum amplum]|uniref:alpha-1,2-Mannosidase n=1 Tax=Schizophyllum amplum TaxID=97359 RepID=A0A550C7K6_9AGAR|nr:glycoside hydrolase family 47 protein [Auriculariopsis ampla]